MKELTRLEMASVKRAFQTTKPFRTKKAKLIEKINSLQQDVKALEDMIEMWETPIRKITGGYTSEEVMNGALEIPEENVAENTECSCCNSEECQCDANSETTPMEELPGCVDDNPQL